MNTAQWNPWPGPFTVPPDSAHLPDDLRESADDYFQAATRPAADRLPVTEPADRPLEVASREQVALWSLYLTCNLIDNGGTAAGLDGYPGGSLLPQALVATQILGLPELGAFADDLIGLFPHRDIPFDLDARHESWSATLAAAEVGTDDEVEAAVEEKLTGLDDRYFALTSEFHGGRLDVLRAMVSWIDAHPASFFTGAPPPR